MFYIFYGGDELSRDEALRAILARVPDPAMAELNTTRLDGRKLTYSELHHACNAMPFLADRRIVIVDGLLDRLKTGPKELADHLRDELGNLPQTTRLFLVEGDKIDKRLAVWKTAQQLAEQNKGVIKEFAAPDKDTLPQWVRQRIQQHGGKIEPRAAEELATYLPDDLRLLDAELDKLVTYARERPITLHDVHLLVPYAAEANIFEMADAIGRRDLRGAMARLQRLLADGEHPLRLLPMISRQVRILLQLKELSAAGATANELREKLGLAPFVINKTLPQTKNFSMEELERAFERLLETDVAIKTGQTDPELAIEMLVTELATAKA
jgi:DNA polymerase-3 subunit delta